jgi:hypothetical protein
MSTLENKREQRLRQFGKWVVSPFFSLGSAIITTVAIGSLPFIAGLALPWLLLILGIAFATELGVSLYTFKTAVPNTLVEVFAQNIFKELTPAKKIILGLGIFSALGGGLAIGALTYLSGITAFSALLSLLSLSFPPLGIALAATLALAGFIAVSSLFINRLASAIKNDLHKKIVPFFKKIFTRDHSKAFTQQVLEGSFKLLFIVGIIGVIAIGTIATLGTMHKALGQLLTLIPNANAVAVKISSGLITYALFGLARLPLILQSVCEVFSQLGEALGRSLFKLGRKVATLTGLVKPQTPVVVEEESDNKLSLTSAVKTTALLINAVSSAALARNGGGQVVTEVLSKFPLSLSPCALNSTGQIASAISKGVISLGLNAYTFFEADKKPKNVPILTNAPEPERQRVAQR